MICLTKKTEYVITNMVASASLGLELDLYSLASKIPEIEYEPEQFPGAILKFKEPTKASLLLFKNGKVVCVGCKRRDLIDKTIQKTIKMLTPYAKRITKTKKPKIEITNIVASANLHLELDLYKIAYKLKDVEYEPEQFPGAILKFRDPKASLLLFKNGKVICAGAKSEDEIKQALAKAKKLLKPYAEKVKRR
ncbi:TATA-box-binding protein [Candidatus Micrarchaeota archaeon]|nr:TATA-box-binding protein [Candidatus Micrarchaeota archaeon]MBU1166057.1 TATA-box-binding protein [Candidatus Micrarchaeota archaeon]MBU1886880.1 TATA-box-binding protein [Candidatus Micrarchaeota archaeon]